MGGGPSSAGVGKKALTSVQDELSFVTLNKDHKPVWEPGLRAEVVSRRQRPDPRKVAEKLEDAPVPCDLKSTVLLHPEQKAEWLEKAFKGIPKGKAKVVEIYDILMHPKFSYGIPPQVGQQMFQLLRESLLFFTEKQRVHLVKCDLAKQFGPSLRKRGGRGEDDRKARSQSRGRRRRSRSRSRSSRSCTRSRSRSPSQDRVRKSASRSRSCTASKPGQSGEITATEEGVLDEAVLQQRSEEEAHKREIERELFEERQRKFEQQQEEQRKKYEAERKLHEEREKQRKAKVGNAFLMVGDDEAEEEKPQVPANLHQLRNRESIKRMAIDQPLPYHESVQVEARNLQQPSAGSSHAVDAMGGDRVMHEAFEILARGGGSQMLPAKDRRRSRSVSRRRRGPRESGSLRSPTPDGKWRGQMRAANKARMIANLLGPKRSG